MSKVKFTRYPWFLAPSFLIAAVAALLFTVGHKVNTLSSLNSPNGCGFSDSTGNFLPAEFAYYEGEKIAVPGQEKEDTRLARVLGESSGADRWIEVNLSEQKLIAHEGDQVFLETKISSGLPWTPTPPGEFRIWGKFKYTKMEGGSGKYYYNLPNVPYVMFFENPDTPNYLGYGLHGTYWHNDFGKPHSHGCVNLPTPIAKQLFYWTGPVLPEGKGTVRASADNPGTRIVIHN